MIGTGKTDYSVFVIASRHFSPVFDTHLNLGYTLVGQSVPGMHLSNLIFAGVAGEYRFSPRFDLVGEVFGNTASGSGGDAAETTPTKSAPRPPFGASRQYEQQCR